MESKIGKTLKNLLYGIPIALASFLPTKEANGQMIKSPDKYFSSKYAESADIEKPNTIFLTFQPCDLGLGIRYDRRISSKFGAYSSLSKGNYRFGEREYINNHVKVALGGLFYPGKNFDGTQSFFNLGLNYHTYGERAYELGTINEKVFKPLSIEAGMGVKIGDFDASIRFDPIKREGSWDLGFSF